MNILNLCDINDEAKNIYHEELLKYFNEDQVDSIKYDPEANPAEFVLNQIYSKYDLIVGHGFGGLLALVIGRATGARTILINPMYPAARYWSDLLPDYKYKKLINSLTHNDVCWDTHGMTTKDVFLILGKDDDLIDTATLDKYLTNGNCFYVEGGHWPSGEDFVLKFGELTGGLVPTGDGFFEKADNEKEQVFAALSEFIQIEEKYKLLYLYTIGTEDAGRLTQACKKYMHSLEDSDDVKCRYITADSLPADGAEVRKIFNDVDFLVVDKIVRIVLNDEIRRALWIACDEVTGHGGKVMLLSEDHAADLFKEDKALMDLIYTGVIKEFDFYYYKHRCGLHISFDSSRGDDTRPYEDYYRTVIIDDIKTQYGNLAIKWHSPELEDMELYLYFKDGQWFYDGKDGWCRDHEAKAVLRAAADKFVDGAKRTDHDAHHFFGWEW